MAMGSSVISYTLDGIAGAAAELLKAAEGYRILAFSGGLGAGKTTLINALCRKLGVEDNVSSPTFALINEYHYPQGGKDSVIYHMDWYRLRDADEAINAGMEDCLLNEDALCLVEWPEQAPEILRTPYLYITIGYTGGDDRKLSIERR